MFTRIVALSITFLLLSTHSFVANAEQEGYTLAIQPILSQKELKKSYQPLADYLSNATGKKITITTQRSFVFYWHKMRKAGKGFDLVLDAAHFTDYRAQNLGYTVLAKMPDTVSFSLVTSENNFILDADELTNKKIATMPSPSLGSVRLEELYPNPMQIPDYVWERNNSKAVESVISGKVDAAIIPTRLASNYDNLNIVLTTDTVPHMALSASPDIPVEIAQKIQQALINAENTTAGRKMLEKLNTDKFEHASNETYSGYGELLKDVYGYVVPLSSKQSSDDDSILAQTDK